MSWKHYRYFYLDIFLHMAYSLGQYSQILNSNFPNQIDTSQSGQILE